ncbi:glucose-1-phosphate adenylyltransferase, GlgD subunit [Desulforamulus reducens MI-1]|uniref:Glucose-1-phosphate adenylyltransferase, GlgD subunit n=1 Tax=Desulforamulus reducens (strain ATCC BAA-1160 / DSM 100696 / MI-1) TaxID=349161 RepID=A4J4I3_DESRM|nr:glucose-1-phosphate adenylyltransferase subunit GlgD [Desulforamulus reducens]ABO49986.1 glucose-1-phosphate adenylyltransferase, GlgD subunit [Desulforamulus reducens MI-1]
MKNVMGIINIMENEDFLMELSYHRPVAAVPFGGRYRMIDFVLSNMVNSGIQNVGILVQNSYRALMDHLGRGKEWDLDRKRDGLFFLPPDQYNGQGIYRWDLRHFYTHLDYINYSRHKYVLISGSNMLCNINYQEAFEFHQAMNADITLIYKDMESIRDNLPQSSFIDIAEDGRIFGLEISPTKINSFKMSMEMCLMKKSLLVDLINCCYSRGECDLIRDGFIKNLHRLRVYGFPYQGYLATIDNIQSYYKHSMDLLKPEIWRKLFFEQGLIYTKPKDGAPTKYNEGARVSNALIANDCIIDGFVENSIIFRGVKIGRGAHVKDSIIMQKCDIQEDAVIESVIADKEVIVTKVKHLKGEKHYPLVIKKRTII